MAHPISSNRHIFSIEPDPHSPPSWFIKILEFPFLLRVWVYKLLQRIMLMMNLNNVNSFKSSWKKQNSFKAEIKKERRVLSLQEGTSLYKWLMFLLNINSLRQTTIVASCNTSESSCLFLHFIQLFVDVSLPAHNFISKHTPRNMYQFSSILEKSWDWMHVLLKSIFSQSNPSLMSTIW